MVTSLNSLCLKPAYLLDFLVNKSTHSPLIGSRHLELLFCHFPPKESRPQTQFLSVLLHENLLWHNRAERGPLLSPGRPFHTCCPGLCSVSIAPETAGKPC